MLSEAVDAIYKAIKIELSNLFRDYDMLSDAAPLKTMLQLLPLLSEADSYLKRKGHNEKEFVLTGVKVLFFFFFFSSIFDDLTFSLFLFQ